MSASAPGLGDRADEGGDAPVVAAQLEDLLDDGAVLGLELADRSSPAGDSSGLLVGLDEEAAAGVGLGGAGDGAVQAVQGHGVAAAGQPHLVGHLGHGADLRVLALVLGHEQHALLVADVDGQRHAHVGEDDDVVQRHEQQLAHGVFTLLGKSSC